MPRPPLLLLATTLLSTSLAFSAPPTLPGAGFTALPTEVLGLTEQGTLVFRRGPTLFRLDAGAREPQLVDASPLGALTPVHLGLSAPGGAAVVYPVQTPATPEPGPTAAAAPADVAPPGIAADRPVRLVRIDGDGDDVIGELQLRCPPAPEKTRPGRRRNDAAPVERAPSIVSLDIHVAWTARDVIVLGTVTCGTESQPYLFTAPLRPAIADGLHSAVATTLDMEALSSVPALQRASALAALEPSAPQRLLALAEAHALSGDAAAAVSALWRLSALGPVAAAALDAALASDWVAALEGRAAYRALVSSRTPTIRGDARSPNDPTAPPPEDSP